MHLLMDMSLRVTTGQPHLQRHTYRSLILSHSNLALPPFYTFLRLTQEVVQLSASLII